MAVTWSFPEDKDPLSCEYPADYPDASIVHAPQNAGALPIGILPRKSSSNIDIKGTLSESIRAWSSLSSSSSSSVSDLTSLSISPFSSRSTSSSATSAGSFTSDENMPKGHRPAFYSIDDEAVGSSTSCASRVCVFASPCQRMAELSDIHTHEPDNRDDGSTARHLTILDNACGPAALVTSHLLRTLSVIQLHQTQFVASDSSSKFVKQATRRISDLDWADHVLTLKMDMLRLEGLGPGEFTHVFSNFSISQAEDAHAALQEMYRILAPGGVCTFSVWKRLSWLEVLADAINIEFDDSPGPFPSHDCALTTLTRDHTWHDITFIRKMLNLVGFSGSVHDTSPQIHECDSIVQAGLTETQEDPPHKDEKHSDGMSGEDSRLEKPTTDNCRASSQNGSNSVSFEEHTSVHRYTKHEFLQNFGTSVVERILSQAWGKQYLQSKQIKHKLRLAICKHLVKHYPGELTEIELEFTSLLVVARKAS